MLTGMQTFSNDQTGLAANVQGRTSNHTVAQCTKAVFFDVMEQAASFWNAIQSMLRKD